MIEIQVQSGSTSESTKVSSMSKFSFLPKESLLYFDSLLLNELTPCNYNQNVPRCQKSSTYELGNKITKYR